VAADDHVLHAEDVDRVLQHRQAVEVGVHHDVRDVAVDEDLARGEPDDLVRRHAAVGAADPEVLGRLAPREPGEEGGVAGHHLGRPGAVAVEELGDVRHDGDATAYAHASDSPPAARSWTTNSARVELEPTRADDGHLATTQ